MLSAENTSEAPERDAEASAVVRRLPLPSGIAAPARDADVFAAVDALPAESVKAAPIRYAVALAGVLLALSAWKSSTATVDASSPIPGYPETITLAVSVWVVQVEPALKDTASVAGAVPVALKMAVVPLVTVWV